LWNLGCPNLPAYPILVAPNVTAQSEYGIELTSAGSAQSPHQASGRAPPALGLLAAKLHQFAPEGRKICRELLIPLSGHDRTRADSFQTNLSRHFSLQNQ